MPMSFEDQIFLDPVQKLIDFHHFIHVGGKSEL